MQFKTSLILQRPMILHRFAAFNKIELCGTDDKVPDVECQFW